MFRWETDSFKDHYFLCKAWKSMLKHSLWDPFLSEQRFTHSVPTVPHDYRQFIFLFFFSILAVTNSETYQMKIIFLCHKIKKKLILPDTDLIIVWIKVISVITQFKSACCGPTDHHRQYFSRYQLCFRFAKLGFSLKFS